MSVTFLRPVFISMSMLDWFVLMASNKKWGNLFLQSGFLSLFKKETVPKETKSHDQVVPRTVEKQQLPVHSTNRTIILFASKLSSASADNRDSVWPNSPVNGPRVEWINVCRFKDSSPASGH